MKRIPILVLAALLILVSAAGCSKKQTATTVPAEQSAPAATETKKDAGTPEVPLTDIMKQTQSIKGAYYEMKTSVATGQGTVTSTSKNWITGNKVRVETESMGLKTVTIVTADGFIYLYNPANKTATRIGSIDSEAANQWAFKDPAKYKVLGREKISEQQCVIISNIDIPDENKMWISEAIGMPLKMEATVAGGKATSEFSNIKLGPQDEGLFTLPAGTTIIETPRLPGH
ncbi:MAG: hypothetical protein ABRQ26_03000 [Syntrophomonadaceae bacterium]